MRTGCLGPIQAATRDTETVVSLLRLTPIDTDSDTDMTVGVQIVHRTGVTMSSVYTPHTFNKDVTIFYYCRMFMDHS